MDQLFDPFFDLFDVCFLSPSSQFYCFLFKKKDADNPTDKTAFFQRFLAFLVLTTTYPPFQPHSLILAFANGFLPSQFLPSLILASILTSSPHSSLLPTVSGLHSSYVPLFQPPFQPPFPHSSFLTTVSCLPSSFHYVPFLILASNL